MIFLLLTTVAFAVMGAVLSFICTVQEGRRNSLTLTVGVCHIFAGMQNLLALVVFLSAVLGEVGHKLTAESPIDDPVRLEKLLMRQSLPIDFPPSNMIFQAFLYACGYSFYCAVVAFMCTEVTAALSLCVYMAAHDERMFNRYQIRTIMRTGSSHSMSESLGQKRKIGGPQGRRFRRSSSGGFRVRSLSSTDIQSPKVSVSDANLGPFSRDMTNCSFITDSGVFTDISTNVWVVVDLIIF